MKETNTPDSLTGTSFYSLMQPQDCMEIREEFSQSTHHLFMWTLQKHTLFLYCMSFTPYYQLQMSVMS